MSTSDPFAELKVGVVQALVPGACSQAETVEAIAEVVVSRLGRFYPVRVYWYGLMAVVKCNEHCYLIDHGPRIIGEMTALPCTASFFGEMVAPSPRLKKAVIRALGLRRI